MPNNLTFRTQLRGMVSEVLDELEMSCAETQKAMVDLVVELSHYTEEGQDLFPRLVICDEKGVALRLVQGSDALRLGSGPRTPETAKRALKKCAPLARGGWSIYLERTELGGRKEFEFGVFRLAGSPASLDLRESISVLEKDTARVLLLFQVARRSVGVVGPGRFARQVHLSAEREDSASPLDALLKLTDAAVSGVAADAREPVKNFLSSVLMNSLQGGHGTLLAVVGAGQTVSEALARDATMLPAPLDLVARVGEHTAENSSMALGALISYGDLLAGMLASDGITILSADGKVLGYNAFVKPPPEPEGARQSENTGGARRRAYAVLEGLVRSGELVAVYIKSSDGHAECRREER